MGVNTETFDVVIVGAGAAGLTCATKLLDFNKTLPSEENHRLKVAILESSDHVGGRIRSISVAEAFPNVRDDEWCVASDKRQKLDLGAQWIHGWEGNVAFRMAKKLELIDDHLKSTLEDIGDTFYFDDGVIAQIPHEVNNHIKKELNIDESSRSIEALIDAINSVEVSENHSASNVSMADSLCRKTERFIEINKMSVESASIIWSLVHYFKRWIECDEASVNWEKVSARYSAEVYEWIEGKNVTFKSEHSFQDFIDQALIPQISIDLNCKLLKNHCVRKISGYDEKAGEGDSANLVEIEIYDTGEEIKRVVKANTVVVTVSLGVLKKCVEGDEDYGIKFEPQLPEQKMETIRLMEFGTVVKIYFLYPSIWWSEEIEGFGFLYRNKRDRTSLEEKSTDERKVRCWTDHILGLYRIAHIQTVMCCWVSGHGAMAVEKKFDESEIINDFHTFCVRFLSKDHPSMTKPIALKMGRWHLEEGIWGAYSNISCEADAKKLGPHILSQPVHKLRFAGEATSSSHHSTVNGAMESGEREAERIINEFKRKP